MESIKSISLLLDNGFSIKNCLDIIKNKKNERIINEIDNKLNNGYELIEAISGYLSKKIKLYLNCFYKYMSFTDALSLTINILENKNKRNKEIYKNLMYPLLLFFGMIFGLFLFSIYLLPTLSSLAASFSNINIIDSSIINRIIFIFIIFIILSILLFIILFSDKYLINTYKMLYKYNNKSFIIDVFTEQFVYIFNSCLIHGLSTKQSLNIIASLNISNIPSFIAKSIDENLYEGNEYILSLKNAYLSPSFIKFMNIAIKTNSPESVISSYLNYLKNRIDIKIKIYSKVIQAIVYLLIGLLIIYIYSLLLFPINILQNI